MRFTSILALASAFVLPMESAEPLPSASSDDKLTFTKWSGKLNIPDPVSISLDNLGRAYVTQTQRRKANDLDIRANSDWIVSDLSFQSVEDKRAFYRERMDSDLWMEGMRVRVADLNQDGSRDWMDLTVLTEKIHLVEDTNGDGTADRMHTYAEDFRTEVTGIAAGVLWHAGDVYATIAPDVWKLRDTNGDDKADQRESIAHGFGLHIAYGGHDMHGLTVGPDGKIYWTIGDKGISVTTRDGRKFLYPNQGGMMRCNPDGSDFEVYAHGLRNVQEPAFDEFGNWFGVDNDSDQSGEKERFVYIVQGMDAGWRNHYQYRGGDYNPWMKEKLWQPYQEGQPAYIIPPISNYIDGPAGFVYNPGTALSSAYRQHFFLTGAPNGNQYAFRTEPRGASFVMVDDRQIGRGIPLVGMTFGPDGALYSVDWGGGYPLNQKGAIWKIDHQSHAMSSERLEVKRLLGEGFTQRNSGDLQNLLGHLDQRIRLGAQFELARRGDSGTLLDALKIPDQMARVHAAWGLGQLARQGDQTAQRKLLGLLKDGDMEIRVQAVKMLGDLEKGAFNAGRLLPLLGSENPRLLFHVGLALHKHAVGRAVKPLVTVASTLAPDQVYMRHAMAYGLAGCADPEQLSALATHENRLVRTIAVLALREQGSPDVTVFLDDPDKYVAAEAARAVHDDWSIQPAMPSLAAALERAAILTQGEDFIRRSINANFRLGASSNALMVARYAAREDAPKPMRLAALAALQDWMEPAPLDRVTGRYRDFDPDTRHVSVASLTPPVELLLKNKDAELQAEAMMLTTRLGLGADPATLLNLVSGLDKAVNVRVAALNALADGNQAELEPAIQVALNTASSQLRMRGLQLFAKTKPQLASRVVLNTIAASRMIPERQNAAALLGDIATPLADEWLISAIQNETELNRDPSIQLEVFEAMEKRAAQSKPSAKAWDALNEKLLAQSGTNPLASFEACLEGGDVDRGRAIFENHLIAQCARCHSRKNGQGSNIGPNLQAIGDKDKRELLHSILYPNATITEGYGNITVVLNDGSTIGGYFREETGEVLTIRNADGIDEKVVKTDIRERTPIISLMPPMREILQKRELRDVLAYLTTLRSRK